MLMHLNKILKVQPQRWMAVSVSIDLGWLVGWLVGWWVGWWVGGLGGGLGRRETGGRRQLVVHQPQLFHHFSKHIWARTYLAKCKIGWRMSLNILAETTLPLIWGGCGVQFLQGPMIVILKKT